MTDKVLVAEPNKIIASLLATRIRKNLKMDTVCCTTMEETQAALQTDAGSFFVAVVDLDLPGAEGSDVVDMVTENGVACMVLTHSEDHSLRRRLFSKNIVDYWIKEYTKDFSLVVQAIEQLRANTAHKVLIVDDSRGFRKLVALLLRRKRYDVMEAGNGVEAMAILETAPDIKLVITDYEMPEMDGFDLIHNVRKLYNKSHTAILGLSSSEEEGVTAKFLKVGANDFLKKPFEVEEFFCRVSQNLEMIDMFQQIKDASNTDFLTKLFNRKYFFETAPSLFRRAAFSNDPLAVAMMDIDHFKRINDTYGHDGGDGVLKATAQKIKEKFRPQDIVARFGGEEFCVLFGPIGQALAWRKLNQLRAELAETSVAFGETKISITISIGLCMNTAGSLEEVLRQADLNLYEAKQSGRNRVMPARLEA